MTRTSDPEQHPTALSPYSLQVMALKTGQKCILPVKRAQPYMARAARGSGKYFTSRTLTVGVEITRQE